MIELKNINIIYNKKECIRNGCFKAKSGNITGIYGESGTGKSSLLYMIGMLSDQFCEYYYNNELLNLSEEEKAKFRYNHISFITQNSMLIDTISVEKNIEFFLSLSNIEYTVDDLLDFINLSSKKKAMPKTLSGGERQRVAVACAIAKDSDIILADEITSALDEDNKNSILDLLKECAKQGKIVILVSHERKTLDICNRLYRLDHLELIEEKNLDNAHMNHIVKKIKNKRKMIKCYDLLFYSSSTNNKGRVLVSCIIMFILFFSVSFLLSGFESLKIDEFSVENVSKNKVLVLNDESHFYHTVQYGFALRDLEYFEPLDKNIDLEIKKIKDINECYNYYVFEYTGFNKNGGLSTMALSAVRNNKVVEKRESSDEYEITKYNFSVIPYYDEDEFNNGEDGVYVNDNLAFIYNLEVGDALELELNVPFAMAKSISSSIEEMVNKYNEIVEGNEYYKVVNIYEQVKLKTKVLGIVESNSEQNREIYMSNDIMENLISMNVQRYNNHEIEIAKESFESFYNIIPLQPYAKAIFVDSFENVLKVQNKLNSISENIFTYSEYQNITGLIEDSRSIGITSFVVLCLTLLVFMVGAVIVQIIYLKRFKSTYMMMNLIGENKKNKMQIYVLHTIHQILLILFMSIFIYVTASLPDILPALGIMTMEEVWLNMDESVNLFYAYGHYTSSHNILFITLTFIFVSTIQFVVIKYYNKQDIIKWLRGE